MFDIYAGNYKKIPIGHQGEENAVRVLFSAAKWEKLYGTGGTFALTVTPPGGDEYPAQTERVGDFIAWVVGLSDTGLAGDGKCELFYSVGSTLAKKEYSTILLPCQTPGDPPDAWENWVARLALAENRVNEAADAVLAFIPEGGTEGQVLTKTADGTEWADPQGGGGEGAVKYTVQSLDEPQQMQARANQGLYYKEGNSRVLIPDTTIHYPSDPWEFDQEFDPGEALVVGKTYAFIINGQKFTAEAKYAAVIQEVYLGNLSLWESGEDTGEPFFLSPGFSTSTSKGLFLSSDYYDSDATFSLLDEGVTYHKIPAEYLPDEIAEALNAMDARLAALEEALNRG